MKKYSKKMILVAALGLIFVLKPSTALASENFMVLEEPELVTLMDSAEVQEKEHIAIEKYNLLLKEWAKNPLIISDTEANFPEFYGGAYINEKKDLVIQVTNDNLEVRDYFSKVIDLSGVVFEEVEYNYARLLQEMQCIEEKLMSATQNLSESEKKASSSAKITAIGIDTKRNSISVYVDDSENNLRTSNFDKSFKAEVSSFDKIDIVPNSPMGKTMDVTVRAGGQVKKSSGGDRSLGFWARKSNGDIGFVTAPHNSISNGTYVYNRDNTFLGIAQTPYFGGKLDAVFIKKTGVGITVSNTSVGWSFNLRSGAYTNLPVGSTVYSSGYKHSSGYGTVQNASYSLYVDANGETYFLQDVVRTSIAVSPGDSGGFVAAAGNTSTRYVGGIISASAPGSTDMVCIKMSNIATTLGVQVY